MKRSKFNFIVLILFFFCIQEDAKSTDFCDENPKLCEEPTREDWRNTFLYLKKEEKSTPFTDWMKIPNYEN